MRMAEAADQPAAKRDKDDFKDSARRRTALQGIEMWYAERVYHRRARFQKGQQGRAEPNVPPEYLPPESFIGPSLKADGATAHGVETKPTRGSQAPRGRGIELGLIHRYGLDDYLVQQRELAELRQVVSTAMFDLIMINPRYHMVVEMWAAGWSFGSIASTLSVSRPTAMAHFDCGVVWVCGCILRRQKHIARAKMRCRRVMREADLYGEV